MHSSSLYKKNKTNEQKIITKYIYIYTLIIDEIVQFTNYNYKEHQETIFSVKIQFSLIEFKIQEPKTLY